MSKNTRNHYFIGGAKRLAACLLCLAMIATCAPLTDVYAYEGEEVQDGYATEDTFLDTAGETDPVLEIPENTENVQEVIVNEGEPEEEIPEADILEAYVLALGDNPKVGYNFAFNDENKDFLKNLEKFGDVAQDGKINNILAMGRLSGTFTHP